VGLPVLGEELWNGSAGAGLEMGVEVEEGPAGASGEEASDGGFTGAHEAGEDETFEVCGNRGRRSGVGAGLGRCGGRHGALRSVVLILCCTCKSRDLLGRGSGRSKTLKWLGVFRDACEDSAGRWIAPIAEGKKHGLEATRHAR